MTIGLSLFTITIGAILMVVGAVGLLVSLWLIVARRAAPEF